MKIEKLFVVYHTGTPDYGPSVWYLTTDEHEAEADTRRSSYRKYKQLNLDRLFELCEQEDPRDGER